MMRKIALAAVVLSSSAFAFACADPGTEGSEQNESEMISCMAMPSCDEGDTAVDECGKDDAKCYSRSLCNKTIWCTDPEAPPVTCLAIPTCDQGDTEVASQSACLQDDARCYQRSLCNQTIWCTGPASSPPITCQAIPSCDAGDQQVPNESQCLQDVACYSRSMCGRTVWCSDTN